MTNPTTANVVVLCANDTTRTFLTDTLSADGSRVFATQTADDARRVLEHHPGALLVDLDTRGAARVMKAAGDQPVLALVANPDGPDRAKASGRAALDDVPLSDYVVKPFSYPELRLRLEALLRRSSKTTRAAS